MKRVLNIQNFQHFEGKGFDSENTDSVIIDTTGCILCVLYFFPILGYMVLYCKMPDLV